MVMNDNITTSGETECENKHFFQNLTNTPTESSFHADLYKHKSVFPVS